MPNRGRPDEASITTRFRLGLAAGLIGTLVLGFLVWFVAIRDTKIVADRNAPQSAHNALNALKKVGARTEVGLNYRDYSTVVGEAWADVKIFAESPEGKKLPEFSFLLMSAMSKHKLAVDTWQVKVDFQQLCAGGGMHPSIAASYLQRYDATIQQCWEAAHRRIDIAESLISQGDIATALRRVSKLQETDENYEAAMRSEGGDSSASSSEMGHSKGAVANYTKALEREIAAIEAASRAGREYTGPETTGETPAEKEASSKMDEIDKQDRQICQGP